MNKIYVILLILLSFSGCEEKKEPQQCPSKPLIPAFEAPTKVSITLELETLQQMIQGPCTPECCESYIQDVIDEGSDVLGLPSGSMAAGYAYEGDSIKIAAYVVTLSGKKSPHPNLIEEGSMLYSGNCAGCHGSDAKGNGGSYPDLTLKELKGMHYKKSQMHDRIAYLKRQLKEIP